tara:strand:+ start:7912 stop:8058 length:147 start_codon:yes stop_codon:yes gene_type:complete
MERINYNVVILNLIALGFLVLTFTHYWMFIIGAVFFSGWGYRKLIGYS